MNISDNEHQNIEELSKKQSDGKISQADMLVQQAENFATFFHDDLNEAYAKIQVGDHYEIRSLKSSQFQRWLNYCYYSETKKTPTRDSIQRAIQTLEAKACFSGNLHKLELRVAEYDGSFWYDLANSNWESIQIRPNHWDIVKFPPIIFKRYTNTAAQVTPVKDTGDVWKIFDYVNLANEQDKLLFVVSLISCYVPDIPHVISIFHGTKGAAKSTTLKILRKIVDPASRDLFSISRDESNLTLQLANNYMPAYDNLDGLTNEQSDTLCRAVTGGGLSKRRLYTDNEEIIFHFKRCIIMNGINIVATKSDLLDRAIVYELERIDTNNRQTEQELWRKFDDALPVILGGIFNVLAKAMDIYPSVKLSKLPRMADFCKWGYAIAESLEVDGNKFLEAYYNNINKANNEAIANHPLASGITIFMKNKNQWEGTAAQLLNELWSIGIEEKLSFDKRWPKSTNSLTRRLNEFKADLMQSGIQYDSRRTNLGCLINLAQIKSAENTVNIVTLEIFIYVESFIKRDTKLPLTHLLTFKRFSVIIVLGGEFFWKKLKLLYGLPMIGIAKLNPKPH